MLKMMKITNLANKIGSICVKIKNSKQIAVFSGISKIGPMLL